MGCLFNEKHLDMVSIFVRCALCAFRILHFLIFDVCCAHCSLKCSLRCVYVSFW